MKALCYIFQCIRFHNNKKMLNMKSNAKNSFSHTLILAINTWIMWIFCNLFMNHFLCSIWPHVCMVSPTPISIIISTSKIRYDHIEGAFYASKLCSKSNIKNNWKCFLGILLEYLCYSSFFLGRCISKTPNYVSWGQNIMMCVV